MAVPGRFVMRPSRWWDNGRARGSSHQHASKPAEKYIVGETASDPATVGQGADRRTREQDRYTLFSSCSVEWYRATASGPLFRRSLTYRQQTQAAEAERVVPGQAVGGDQKVRSAVAVRVDQLHARVDRPQAGGRVPHLAWQVVAPVTEVAPVAHRRADMDGGAGAEALGDGRAGGGSRL